MASLLTAILHEAKALQSGVLAWTFGSLFLVSASVYFFALATASVFVSASTLERRYFGLRFGTVRIDSIVAASITVWGMRRRGRGPYLLLRVTETSGRTIGFTAPAATAEPIFTSIVATVNAKKTRTSSAAVIPLNAGQS
ncbi:MAG TPA: hypothetical protein VM029_18265 [Opitutaceae bacterium]|nr:hypothetical protein [Opitutaceae bacterium]